MTDLLSLRGAGPVSAARPGEAPPTRSSDLARRFSESARALESPAIPDAHVEAWFAACQARNTFQVTRIPFERMAGWNVDSTTGTVAHDSGRFFSVEGLRVQDLHGGWEQPILVQREIGILGIVVADLGGVLHCLMQAKAEPGNTAGVRLSPTVNATRSNYTGVHRGRAIPYIDAFTTTRRDHVIVDRLQSERGAWFLRKRNRHLVVAAPAPIPEHDDFCWLTLGQLRRLSRRDNVMSMEACSVLSCLPVSPPRDTRGLEPDSAFRDALLRSLSDADGSAMGAMTGAGGARHDIGEVIGRLCEVKARNEVGQRRIPLREITPWGRLDDEISRPDGKYFTVIGAEVHADSREVAHWRQPLLAPVPGGIAAMFTRVIDGVLHLLLHARVEAGSVDVAEFGPTVLCTPDNYRDVPAAYRPRYLDAVLTVDAARIRYDVILSEEGARFYHAESRYLVIDVGDGFPVDVPDDFVWVTMAQAGQLLAYGYYLNMQARTLLAAMQSLW